MRPGGRGREGKAKDCNKAAGAGPKAQWGQGAKASPQPHPQPQATRSDALHKFSGGQLKGASGTGHLLYLVHAETPDSLYLAAAGSGTPQLPNNICKERSPTQDFVGTGLELVWNFFGTFSSKKVAEKVVLETAQQRSAATTVTPSFGLPATT